MVRRNLLQHLAGPVWQLDDHLARHMITMPYRPVMRVRAGPDDRRPARGRLHLEEADASARGCARAVASGLPISPSPAPPFGHSAGGGQPAATGSGRPISLPAATHARCLWRLTKKVPSSPWFIERG